MASAIARPNFYFHLNRLKHSQIAPPHFASPKKPTKPIFIALSVDVSQEDKPTESKTNTDTDPDTDTDPNTDVNGEPEIDSRRMEEKFAVINTGIYQCGSCGYLYNEKVGDPSYPIAPGLEFSSLPSDWRCPTCGAAQSFFRSKSVEIAGFAQNQQFGLGGNSLTSGQKTLLIYGTLLFFFALFLSGYFLQ